MLCLLLKMSWPSSTSGTGVGCASTIHRKLLFGAEFSPALKTWMETPFVLVGRDDFVREIEAERRAAAEKLEAERRIAQELHIQEAGAGKALSANRAAAQNSRIRGHLHSGP
jgi:hypothetical protein